MSVSKHCPLCNRSSDETMFYGEFCRYCTEEKLTKKIPDNVEAHLCKRCGRLQIGSGRFAKLSGRSLETALQHIMNKFIVHVISFDEQHVVIDVTEEGHRYNVSAEKTVGIKFRKTMCDTCVRKACSYYEAVLQLRGDEERVANFERSIEKYIIKRGGFISKIEDIDNGRDMYISSKQLVGNYLAQRHIKAVTSYTLYGLKQGKKIYRNTYAIRLLSRNTASE